MPGKVVVRDLKKNYGAVQAVRGVSFEVSDGEIFGLLGPNGAGKTSTLECVIGLRNPDGGHVEVCGYNALEHAREVKERIGAVLQHTALQDKITCREALKLFASFYRKRVEPDVLLEKFSLTEKARARYDTLGGRGVKSAWRSRSRWSTTRNFYCSTNPPPASIRSRAASCTRSSGA